MNTSYSFPEHPNLFDACRLRHAETTRDNYAADLQRALENELSNSTATREFFHSTFPTHGIQEICRRIFSRLTHGEASNEPSIYRLGSSFGGGKTHTLIALAGMARYSRLIREGITPLAAESVPVLPVRLVTFTGENSDLEQGARLEETGTYRAKSLIGHIAWQLGRENAFQRFQRYDENLTSPGSRDIAHLIGSQPCLILIDELVQWLARFHSSGVKAKLADTRTLISSLVQAVESCPQAVLVITTLDAASDAYRRETQQVLDILDELDSILARSAYQTTPSSPPDLPDILRQRLFSNVDTVAREKVSAAYAELCQRSSALIAPSPQDRTVQQWFHENYPFHPDTLRIITDRIASNDDFQKTRGILRLLGLAVHHWKNSGQDENILLIHPHHIDPANESMYAEIITRIHKEAFMSAITSDITDPDSTANRMDRTRPTDPTFRLARTALLASLAPVESARGLTALELTRAVITPYDEDPSVVTNAIAEFRNGALYVNDDPNAEHIYFTTVANIRRLLQERSNALTVVEVKQHIRRAITDCFTMPQQRSKSHLAATIFPSGSDIPDNLDAVSLGIINYEWLTQSEEGLLPALIDFYRNSPLSGGQSPRQFKNNLCILVADTDDPRDMEHHARWGLAARRLKDQPPDNLQPHQQDILASELASAEKNLYLAIQKLYVNLYYPSTDRPIADAALLQYVPISPEVAAERPGDGQHAVVHTLTSRRKLVTQERADLDPESYWQRKLGRRNGEVSLSELREEFAREPGNYMLLDRTVFGTLLRNALDREAIVVQTGTGQTIVHGRDLARTDYPDAFVYLKEHFCTQCNHAQKECQCSRPPRLCPRCGKPQHAGDCKVVRKTIPNFTSGLELLPLKVLAQNLRDHMKLHEASTKDIDFIVLRSDKAEFVTFMAGLVGQQSKATVSYRLQRGADIDITVSAMDIRDWSTDISSIASHLERLRDAKCLESAITISGNDNTEEQLDLLLHQLHQLSANRMAGMEAVFIQKIEH